MHAAGKRAAQDALTRDAIKDVVARQVTTERSE
jgi:hypothetical protein